MCALQEGHGALARLGAETNKGRFVAVKRVLSVATRSQDRGLPRGEEGGEEKNECDSDIEENVHD